MRQTTLLYFATLLCFSNYAQQLPGKQWQSYANPEEAGFSIEKLNQAKQLYDSVGFAATLIIHKGSIVASWGENTRRFMLASMRKSLLSALIGKAIDEGKLDLNSTLRDLNINDITPLTNEEKSAKVKDLLTTRSGVYLPSAFEFKGWKDLKPARSSHTPGTFWYYNNWDFNALCTIYEQSTGKKIFSAFDNEIAKQIGMEDYRQMDGVYYYEPESIHPAYLFKMSSRDLARFGLLYLNKGRWNNKIVIPESWVSLSTQAHATAYDDQYGYLWWATPVNNQKAYTAQGAGSHILTVIPDQDLIIVVRTNDYNRPINNGSDKALVELISIAKHKPAVIKPNLTTYTWFQKERPTSIGTYPINESIIREFTHPQFGIFKIERDKSKITLLTKPARFNMICIGKDEYYIEDMDVKAMFVEAKEPGVKNRCEMIMKPNAGERVLMFYY